MLSLLPSFISCKGHAHLKPTLSPTGCHVPVSLPSANPVALFSIPNLPELQASGTLLGHFPLSCQYSVCWLLLFLCLPPKRKSRQDPLLLTLAPSRTTFTSRLPLQEAFPGTNPTPSPGHSAKPQGVKCQKRSPWTRGGGNASQLQTLRSLCHLLFVLL